MNGDLIVDGSITFHGKPLTERLVDLLVEAGLYKRYRHRIVSVQVNAEGEATVGVYAVSAA